jgi:hypothetical protein
MTIRVGFISPVFYMLSGLTNIKNINPMGSQGE